MGERTSIAWCDGTFNPWWGCNEVSEACVGCYAASQDRRLGGGHWGIPKDTPRRLFGSWPAGVHLVAPVMRTCSCAWRMRAPEKRPDMDVESPPDSQGRAEGDRAGCRA